MSHFPYQFFDEYVVRTPLFSCKSFKEKLNTKEISDEELREICSDPAFREAIYLASPYLFEEINQWISGKNLSGKQFEKLKNTILKYYSRISTRCTPFGLFAGVGLGKFENKNNENNSYSEKVRDTKLDMHFLVGLADRLVKETTIRNQLSFYPNSSIYYIGNKIRYIEYEYNNGKRDYIISSASISIELQQILKSSKEGKTIKQLSELLVNEMITIDDATGFIDELIENQILVSEIEPNVSGNDFLDTLISVLRRINAQSEYEVLILIKNRLEELDQNLGNPILLYSEIEELIKNFETEYEQKYLFQTDLYNKNEFSLPTKWKKELKEGICFLNKITLLQKNSTFEMFKKAFDKRFENQEMPLAYVLDNEIGIGYSQNVQSKGLHPYLDDLILPTPRKKQSINLELSPVHQVLNEKLQESLLHNQTVIKLCEDDFKNCEENWDDLRETISFMAEIVSDDNHEKLILNTNTRSSAADLLARFCSEKYGIQKVTRKITKIEEGLNDNCISAEIIHLPESRVGNVIRRPSLRQYEIPYLAKSVLSKENQILIDDLYISLKNDMIVLRSKKLNKEIKPYLTSVHNYFTNTLPVYHFLSDLYSQNVRAYLYFDWGGLARIYKFLPRVEYKNIILSKAQWRINERDIESLKQSADDKENFLSEFKNWRIKRKLPAWIEWVKFDNTLTINLENYDMIKLFIRTIKSEKSIIIEEFLYHKNDDFKREFIFPMYKNKQT